VLWPWSAGVPGNAFGKEGIGGYGFQDAVVLKHYTAFAVVFSCQSLDIELAVLGLRRDVAIVMFTLFWLPW
jgi:hypothetical protein